MISGTLAQAQQLSTEVEQQESSEVEHKGESYCCHVITTHVDHSDSSDNADQQTDGDVYEVSRELPSLLAV